MLKSRLFSCDVTIVYLKPCLRFALSSLLHSHLPPANLLDTRYPQNGKDPLFSKDGTFPPQIRRMVSSIMAIIRI